MLKIRLHSRQRGHEPWADIIHIKTAMGKLIMLQLAGETI